MTLEPDIPYNQENDFYWAATLLPNQLAVVGSSFAFNVVSLRTGQVVRQLRGHTGGVTAIAASPDERYLVSASDDQTIRIWDPNRSEPLLSLFFAGDEWIAWTPEGYYAASPGGERLMGWHVNTAQDKIADFYPAAQFRKEFYRPEAIKALLSTGSIQRALASTGSTQAVASVDTNLPPEVQIISPLPETRTTEQELAVVVEARQRGDEPLKTLQLLLNGRPLRGEAGTVRLEDAGAVVRHTFKVPVISGVQHTLQARADSTGSYGVSETVTVTTVDHVPDGHTPSLYVLAIGVSDYDDEDLQLTFADDDAERIAQTFKSQGVGLFKKVETRLLKDKQATRQGILEGLVWLRKEMTAQDVGVVFFSGHGERDETTSFYLLPCDVDKASPLLLSGVPESIIKDVVQGIPGRLIVMLDACHAGTLTGDRRKAARSLTDDFTRDLATDDYGVVVMASSMGREFSIENSAAGGGVFTMAIVEGLQGKADYNGDNHVYFNELETYVCERVKELSNGRQHPAISKPGTIRSFPLSRASQE
ncbi:MAG: caspase family protein [Planctomycetaceae bacterium]